MLKFIYKDREYEVKADMLAYDGCHKIYLITDSKDESEAMDYGYELWGVNNLPSVWDSTCPLRFIQFWDVENLKGNLVPQCFDAKIEQVGEDVTIKLKDELPADWNEWMEQWLEGFMEKGVLVYA